jgi:ankyrin repeat protein
VGVVRVLIRPSLLVNQAQHEGATPLYFACVKGHVDVVVLLLACAGIQVNRVEHRGLTPLFMACQKGYLDVVQALLKHPDIDVNYAWKGVTPLCTAK